MILIAEQGVLEPIQDFSPQPSFVRFAISFTGQEFYLIFTDTAKNLKRKQATLREYNGAAFRVKSNRDFVFYLFPNAVFA